jgi:hypothetical protein
MPFISPKRRDSLRPIIFGWGQGWVATQRAFDSVEMKRSISPWLRLAGESTSETNLEMQRSSPNANFGMHIGFHVPSTIKDGIKRMVNRL